MKDFLLRMNLQLFSADTGSEGTPDNADKESDAKDKESTESKDKQEIKGKYTDEDVDKIVQKKYAKWQKELEDKQKEAEKLAKMNAQEKMEHEKKQLEEKIAEYERKETLHSMSKEASKMLTDAELPVDGELLELVTNEDAEVTKKAVQTIIAFASKLIKENARQTTPNDGASFTADKNAKLDVAEIAKKARIIEN